MRILIHGINYAPEVTGVGRYTGEMGRWLAARGHEVRVMSAPPYYPQWSVWEGYSGRRYRRETLEGVKVWRCPLWVPRNPSGTKRLAHLASFAAASAPLVLHQALSWRPDVLLMIEPTLLCLPHSRVASWSAGVPLWVHVQDFELDAALGLGIMRAGAARRALRSVERRLLGLADRVSTITESMRRRLVEMGVPRGKTVVFPNWADLEVIRPLPPDEGIRRELGVPPGGVLVLYAGNMGEKQGLEVVLEAAGLLRGRREIRFVLAGAGAARSRLERAALRMRLGNVRFLPLQPEERLPLLLAAGDIHLVVQRREAADLVMPSKLVNILAAGRPSIATADPGTELHRVLTEQDCGLVVPPGDAGELARAILRLADGVDLRARMGSRARAYAEEYLDRERVLSGFEAALAGLATERRREAARRRAA